MVNRGREQHTTAGGSPMDEETGRQSSGKGAASRAELDQLYQRYHRRLVEFARRKIRHHGVDPAAADGSDVAHDGWKSFWSWAEVAAERKELPADEDGLWRVLTTFVARKVIRRLRIQRRGGRSTIPASS